MNAILCFHTRAWCRTLAEQHMPAHRGIKPKEWEHMNVFIHTVLLRANVSMCCRRPYLGLDTILDKPSRPSIHGLPSSRLVRNA